MNAVARIGDYTLGKWGELQTLGAVLLAVSAATARPDFWKRTVRAEIARQIYSAGVEASRFVAYVAFALGVSVVAQALAWMHKFGQTKSLGPLLVAVLVRQAVPVLTNLLAIARNGTALTTELGTMQASGEVRVLDAQGLDPFVYLVVPRVLGLTIAVFCLNVIFLFVAFASGYVFSTLLSPDIEDAAAFVRSVLVSVGPLDLVNFLAISLFPALFTGAICCIEGLAVGSSVTEVPAAARRALARSVRALFLTTALISFLTYV
jgi:phospholipid/cholesterol/gamma-HCH transport system permease protein